MIHKILVLLISCQSIFCYPQSIKIPDIKNTAQPAEVNSLVQHNLHPRSIVGTPNSYSRNNVEETIKEVEAMLRANPTLPRLTRGEILDLLDNITQTDMAKGKLENKNEEVKVRDPKAIMVVMPYTPSNGNDVNMEELFTKPPVTHIVGAEPFKMAEKDYSFKRIPEEISSIPELGNSKKFSAEKDKSSKNDIAQEKTKPTHPSPSTEVKESVYPQYSAKMNSNGRRRPPTSNIQTPTPLPTTYHPTRRPVRRRTTTTERYPNHKYPDEASLEPVKEVNVLPSTGIRIIDPPKLFPTASDLSEDLQMQENRHQDVFMTKTDKDDSEKKIEVDEVNSDRVVSSSSSPLVDLVPDHLKGVLKGVNLQFEETEKSTTTVPTLKLSEKEEEEKIRNMLASFGVLPVKTTTTTTQVPDISNVADNLTPEMRDLLMSFGLIPDEHEKKPATASTPTDDVYGFNPVKAEVKPEAYVGFKPLPENYSSRDDMEELLARFGLGRNARKEKSLTKKEEDEEKKKQEGESLNFEAVPEQYLGVLEDIGLTERQGKMISSAALVKTQEKQHVFNPGEPQYSSADELEKLTRLLEVVKQIENLNGSVSDDDLKKIDTESLKELISSLNGKDKIVPLDLQSAPNPINYDFGLEKNEVKRQENTTSTTAAPSTATAETQTASIKDLEASFGGQVDTSPVTEEPTPETTTQARRTGFYYLVDWNTFLDIDDQKGKRVNLRFQPKVGDPSRFYSVSVP